MDKLLREGIAAAKSGQRERARELLMRVVEQDEGNIQAWLWLSSVVDSLEDREICLENVLTLDPTSDAAHRGLDWIRKQKEATGSTSTEPPPSPSTPPELESTERPSTQKPISPAAAVLAEDFARRRPPPEPEPEPPPPPPKDEFDDEYQCPYCAAQTAPEDRKCHACGNSLRIKTRRREKRSSWLWVALTLQAANIVWPAFTFLLVLFYAAYRAELHNFFRLVPVYLGLPNDVSPEVAQTALEWVPRVYILPFILYLLYALGVIVGLYLRWKPIFYLFLISAVLTLGSAVAGVAIGMGLPNEGVILNPRIGVLCSGGGVISALMMFFLVLQIEDDFFFDEYRLLLRRDRDATNGPALLDSGRRYARHNMWAMAVIHLRRAVALMPHEIGCHLALSVAYLNLKRYELATSALEEARHIDPHDPQVERLAALLTKRRADQGAPAAE